MIRRVCGVCNKERWSRAYTTTLGWTCKRCRNERPVRKERVVKQKKAPVVLPTPSKKKKGRS